MSCRLSPLFSLVFALLFTPPAGGRGEEDPARPAPAPPAAPPGLTSAGSVTLPYTELRTLWLAAQAKPAAPDVPKPPPVPYILQGARYHLEFVSRDGRQARARATFEILALNNANGWTAVPLLPTTEGARLTGVEPSEALLTVRDNTYTLLLEKPGRHVITLHLDAELLAPGDLPAAHLTLRPPFPQAPVLPTPAGKSPAPGRRTLRLSLPPALVNELTVNEPPTGLLAEVNGHDITPGNALPLAAGQPLALTLVRAEERKPAPPPAPSRWRVEAQSVVRFDESRLLYRTRLRADAKSGAGLALRLHLPPAANILTVESIDLDGWGATRAEGGRQLEILWKTPDTVRREAFVTFELPQPAREGDWPLTAPTPAPEIAEGGGTLTAALFVLPAVPGLEFYQPGNGDAPMNPEAAPGGDARALPRWMAENVGRENFFTVTPPATVVRARRLPLVRTAAATVEEARFHTRLVADGATLTEGTLAVRHEAPLALGFTLPEHAQLLACSVDGLDLAPADRGGGRVELALPVNAHAGKPTRVAFSYAGRERPLAPVSGRVALALPETDLFIQTLRWNLQIPDAYEVEDMDGNVQRDESAPLPESTLKTSAQAGNRPPMQQSVASPANSLTPVLAQPAAAEPPAVIRLRKELLRAERPAVELFYQKRAVEP